MQNIPVDIGTNLARSYRERFKKYNRLKRNKKGIPISY